MSTKGDPFDPERLEEHRDLIRRIARQICRDVHEAEDVEAETLAAALVGSPPEGEESRAWLAVVARRIALRRREAAQSRSHREAVRASGLDTELPSTDDIVAVEEQRKHVLEAVLDLPRGQREAVLARYHLGLSERAAAKRLELPLDTLRDRLKRARAQLRDRLEDQHGGDSLALVAALAPLAWHPRGSLASAVERARDFLGGRVALAVATMAVGVVGALPLLWRSTDHAPRDRGRQSPVETSRLEPDGSSNAAPDSAGLSRALPPESRRELLPTVEGSGSWTGRILDPFGAPVPGATVLLVNDSRLNLHLNLPASDPRGVRRTQTDPEGRFDFGSSVAGRGRFVVAFDGTHAPYTRYLDSPEHVEIELTPGRRLDGRVFDSDGEPVAGVDVDLQWRLRRLRGAARAHTDESGRWSVPGIPAQDPNLIAFAAAFRTADGAQHLSNAAESTLTRGVRLDLERDHELFWETRLDPRRRVEVEVLDAASGQPLAGAGVHLWHDASRSSGTPFLPLEAQRMAPPTVYDSGLTDAAGAWTTALGPTPLIQGGVVRKRAHTWVSCSLEGYASTHALLSVEGDVSRHRLSLAAATSLEGTLADAAGVPLSGAKLRLRIEDWPVVGQALGAPDDPHLVRTGSSGTFSFSDVPVGARGQIEVLLDGGFGGVHRREAFAVGPILPQPAPIELQIAAPEPHHEHWLRVLDDDGTALEGAEILIDPLDWGVRTDVRGVAALLLTGEDRQSLPTRASKLEVWHPEHRPIWFPIDLLDEESSPASPLEIRFPISTPIAGTVLGPDGLGLPEARVLIDSLVDTEGTLPNLIRGKRSAAAFTDAHGRFAGLGRGRPPYQVTAISPFWADGAEPILVQEQTDGAPVTLRFDDLSQLEPAFVRVRAESGKPVARAFARHDGPSGSTQVRMSRAADGSRYTGPLAPGVWELEVRLEGQQAQFFEIDLTPGELRMVEAADVLAGSIGGRNLSQHISIVSLYRDGDEVAFQMVEAGGTYAFDALDSGRYHIDATAPYDDASEDVMAGREVDLEPGEVRADVDLLAEPSEPVTIGFQLGNAGDGDRKVGVRVLRDGKHHRWIGTHKAGRGQANALQGLETWRFVERVAPGELVFEGWIDGVRVDLANASLDAGGELVVRLEAKVD